MNLFDSDKARKLRNEKPEIFWLSWIFLFTITVSSFYIFIHGLMLDALPLLLKGAATISRREHSIGFFIVMAFDLFALVIMTSCLYLIIEKTGE